MKDDSYFNRIIEQIPFLEELPFLTGISAKNQDNCLIIKFEVSINYPQKGPQISIQEREPIILLFCQKAMYEPPKVIVSRKDFPWTSHSSQIFNGRYLCLTRQNSADWWAGQSLVSLAYRVKQWLDDAAAGLLVKPDEPYEPVQISGGTFTVEVPYELMRNKLYEYEGIAYLKGLLLTKKESNGRYVVGGDDGIPCLALYQSKEISTPWKELPKELNGLIKLVEYYGLPSGKLSYWCQKNFSKSKVLLLIIGIQRGRILLGKEETDEWVGFRLTNKNSLQNVKVLVEAGPVRRAFSPALARLTSGWREDIEMKKILLIGAGTLGSAVAEIIARSGLVDITVVDNDKLEPHNLARHLLGGESIGSSKSESLAEYLNALFAEGKPVKAINENFLQMDEKSRIDLVNNSDFILDCSASIAVQRMLADIERKAPSACLYQIAKGKGTVLLVEGRKDPMETRTEGIEAVLISNYKKYPIVESWLEEEVEPIQLGGGCRSLSARIPDSLVKSGAAWASECLTRLIAEDNWPSKAGYGILTLSSSEVISSPKAIWEYVDFIKIHVDCSWNIFLCKKTLDRIRECSKIKYPNETGGILIGSIDIQRQIIYIVEVWEAPDDSKENAYSFIRGHHDIPLKLTLLLRSTKNRLRYAGEWHSHPKGNAKPSALDYATTEKMLEKLEKDFLPAVCLVVSEQSIDAIVLEEKKSAAV